LHAVVYWGQLFAAFHCVGFYYCNISDLVGSLRKQIKKKYAELQDCVSVSFINPVILSDNQTYGAFLDS
jgi:hypothetical protein